MALLEARLIFLFLRPEVSGPSAFRVCTQLTERPRSWSCGSRMLLEVPPRP
jgi:hypothetical protein